MLKAQEVLDDCRLALELLEEEQDIRRWRVLWAGAVALLRAVGHVLIKVDGKADWEIAKLSNQAFAEWKGSSPDHAIFREFIERDRNSILKEYDFRFHPLAEVDIAVAVRLRPVGGGEDIVELQHHKLDENIYRPLLEGFREGDDARDVYQEAIDWWERQLKKIRP